MENELRKHIIALLELMIKYAGSAGLTEERLSEAERNLGLSREVMKEAIRYLEKRGLAKPTFSDPELPYGVKQVFVTDPGKLYYHQLLEESSKFTQKSDARTSVARWISLRNVGWVFASLVFGGYVVSLVAALLQPATNYGITVYIISSYLANMVFPIAMSIFAWMLVSILWFVRQFLVKPIQWVGVVIGGASTLLSTTTLGAVWVSLSATHVSWFVSFLELETSTKFVVGVVSAIALVYVVLSPRIWRERAPPAENSWMAKVRRKFTRRA